MISVCQNVQADISVAVRPQRLYLAEHKRAAIDKRAAEALQFVFFVISMLDFSYRLSGGRARQESRLGVG